MKVLNVIAISALVYGGQPLISDFLPEGFSDQGSAFAKNDGNNGNEGGGNRGNSDRGNSAGNGKSGLHGQSNRSASTRGSHAHATDEEKPKNVHAQLKGLNSLNRNINGLMNSSDPKMDLFRKFVIAGADHAAALAAFTDALGGFDSDGSYQALLDDLGLPAPTTVQEFEATANLLAALATAPEPVQGDFADDAAYQDALDSWLSSTSGAAVALALYENSELSTAVADASASGDASSQDTMIEAMVAGLNATGAGPVTVDDMSPEMIAWVAAQMGIGDADSFIDAYLARIAAEEPTAVTAPIDAENDAEIFD